MKLSNYTIKQLSSFRKFNKKQNMQTEAIKTENCVKVNNKLKAYIDDI